MLLDNRAFPFKAGNIVIANSGIIHSLTAHSKTSYFCVHIDREFCLINSVDTNTAVFRAYIENDSEVYSTVCALYAAVNSDTQFKTVLVNSQLVKLLLLLCEKHTVEPSAASNHGHSFDRVKKLIHFIRQNFDKELSLEKLSKAVGINKYQLTREFKAATGKSLNEHINAIRCNEARKLIEKGIAVSEAAYTCGYRNLSYFSKTYKKHLGELPSYSKTMKK